MKYLLLTNDFYPNKTGGMSNYYTGLAEAVGFESMFVLTPAVENVIEREVNCNVFRMNIITKKIGSFLNKKAVFTKASRIVEDNEIDVVLCGNFRPYTDIAYKLRKKFNTPYYIFFHGNDILRAMKRMKYNIVKTTHYNFLMNRSSGLITNSNYVMSIVPEKNKVAKNNFVLNPGINTCYEQQEIIQPFISSPVKLLSVGRLTKRKGFESVINALSLLIKEGYDAHYDIVGRGETKHLVQLAEDKNVREHITFHGFRTNKEIMEHYKNTDIYIMVSYFSKKHEEVEGFGIVYLEANAFGKPVIASKTGGIPDAVKDNFTGLLVENPLNPSEVAEKIKNLCDNRGLGRKFGLNGYTRVNEHFTYKKIAEKLNAKIIKNM